MASPQHFVGRTLAWYVTAIWSANQPPQFSDLYYLVGRARIATAPAQSLLAHGCPRDSNRNLRRSCKRFFGMIPRNIACGFAYPPYAALLLWPTCRISHS